MSNYLTNYAGLMKSRLRPILLCFIDFEQFFFTLWKIIENKTLKVSSTYDFRSIKTLHENFETNLRVLKSVTKKKNEMENIK